MAGAGGLPYSLLSSAGGRLTSAFLVGLVIPGSAPVFVALIGIVRGRRRPTVVHSAALAAIVAGIALIFVTQSGASAIGGVVVLLLAGLVWVVYTVASQHISLRPVKIVLALGIRSALLTTILVAAGALPSHIRSGTAQAGDLVTFAAVQVVGVVAALGFTIAIRAFGPEKAATSGALTPVLNAVAAVPLFWGIPTSRPSSASSSLSAPSSRPTFTLACAGFRTRTQRPSASGPSSHAPHLQKVDHADHRTRTLTRPDLAAHQDQARRYSPVEA